MRNHRIFTVLIALTGSFFAHSQELYNPDTVLSVSYRLPKVLLVGSYHFAYYNFDAHKTEKDMQVDVLSEKRQEEMEELVAYIARFKPTKIAVESGPNSTEMLNAYREYRDANRTLNRDEREQIGFRLMKQFDLDTLYGIDAGSVLDEVANTEDSSFIAFFQDKFEEYDYTSDDPIDAKYMEMYRIEDSLKLNSSLLRYFQHLNSDKMLERGYGSYLVGDFKLDNYNGVDALSLYWYNRNLRIFRNLQKINESENDRILVIFGSGHVQILKQLLECSAEFELIKFNDL